MEKSQQVLRTLGNECLLNSEDKNFCFLFCFVLVFSIFALSFSVFFFFFTKSNKSVYLLT